jgi:hypothetical protein
MPAHDGVRAVGVDQKDLLLGRVKDERQASWPAHDAHEHRLSCKPDELGEHVGLRGIRVGDRRIDRQHQVERAVRVLNQVAQPAVRERGRVLDARLPSVLAGLGEHGLGQVQVGYGRAPDGARHAQAPRAGASVEDRAHAVQSAVDLPVDVGLADAVVHQQDLAFRLLLTLGRDVPEAFGDVLVACQRSHPQNIRQIEQGSQRLTLVSRLAAAVGQTVGTWACALATRAYMAILERGPCAVKGPRPRAPPLTP